MASKSIKAAHRFTEAHVGVAGRRIARSYPHAKLLEEVGCELIAAGDLEDLRVQVELCSYVEVLHCIEVVVIWWRFGDPVTPDDGSYAGKGTNEPVTI